MNELNQAPEFASNANDVIKIDSLTNDIWYRKPKGARRGPWLSSKFRFIDQELWQEASPCIYFVRNSQDEIKYIGISKNKLKDRWRISPAFDANLKSLNRKELFHSQCWPPMCSENLKGKADTYTISVLHEKELEHLMGPNHTAFGGTLNEKESWFIRNLGDQLWNKQK